MPSLYSIHFYVNGLMTASVPHLTANEAYTEAVPGEATQGGRWHVLMRMPALARLEALFAGESLRICWQDPPENDWGDTEHILILKEPLRIDSDPSTLIPFNLIYNCINDLLNNINLLQNNQSNTQAILTNVYNRLVNLQKNIDPNLIQ